MQIVQLYVQGQRLDMFNDESVNITDSIKNVKDISKVFTKFSQSFTVPASDTNNKIFKHYYNNNIDNGFDARKKVNAKIFISDIEFSSGKVKLEGVDLKNNRPHSYRLTFFGGVVDLKDLLAEDKIGELSWLSNFNMTYNKTEVIDGLREGKSYTVDSVSYPKSLVIPIMTPQQRLYYDSSDSAVGTGNLYAGDSIAHGVEWTQLKPALRIYNIIKAIENKYNTDNGYASSIVFSDDFFNTTNENFYELYMWLHRKEGTVFDNLQGLFAKNINTLPTTSQDGIFFNGSSFSIYDVFSFGARYYTTTINLDLPSDKVFNVVLLKSGTEIYRSDDNTGSTSYAFDVGDLVNGFYEIRIESEAALTLTGDVTTVRFDYNGNQTLGEFDISSFDLLADYEFEITQQIPDMKVIDFLSGLFKMFNLTAYEEDGIIKVQHLDAYYDSGTEYDITKYVDISNISVDSSLLYKEIEFKYNGLGSLQAKKHKEIFNEEWATEKYRGGSDYDGQKYTVGLPFEHMKYERLIDLNNDTNTTVQWGWMVSDLNDSDAYANGSTYLGQPLLFYPNLIVVGTSIRITDAGTYSDTQRYHLPSNALETVESANINFKAELNEYTNEIFRDTLFLKYYSKYIQSVFEFKNRITKVKCYLPLRIVSKYKLSDIFRIKNNKYRINSISTDLLSGESEIELLSLISEYQSEVNPPLPAPGCYSADSDLISVDFTGITVDCQEATPLPTPDCFNSDSLLVSVDSETPTVDCDTQTEVSLPTVTTQSASSVGTASAVLNGAITEVGNPPYTQRGFYWKLGTGDPTSSDNIISVGGTGANSFDALLNSLDDDTQYSYRAFAINTQGTAYGATISFTTQEASSPIAPTVQTTGSSNINETTATIIGNVTEVGNPAYTQKGFYWKLGTGTPTASDNIAYGSGFNAGSYSANLSGLSNNNTYSFRAFVSNGVDAIGLGDVLTFETSTPVVEYAPSVSTLYASPGSDYVYLYGNIGDVGNPNYTEKGFYWKQGTGDPTPSDNVVYVSGTSAGDFSSGIIGGLTTDTTYSFRAFATNTVLTSLGSTLSFVTEEPVTCDGGTLFFQGGNVTGVNAAVSSGNVSYSTGQCGSPMPTTNFNLFNNQTGEWNSTSQVTSIQLFEGSNGGPYGTNVTNDYNISKSLNGGVITISVSGVFPTADDDGDKYLYFQITAVAIDVYQTTINLPSTNAVNHASVNVTANTGVGYPASRDGSTGNTQCVPVGEDGDAFEYTVTYTADSGYEFTGIGNIQPAPTTDNPTVSVSVDSYTSSTITITISGTIQASNEIANLNWGGTAIADPATSFTALYRFGSSGSWQSIPAGGIDVGSGGVIIQVQITPNGSYYVQLGNNIVTASVSPTTAYGGDVTVHDVVINTFSGGEGNQSSLMRVYPRASSSSIGNIRFNYFDSI